MKFETHNQQKSQSIGTTGRWINFAEDLVQIQISALPSNHGSEKRTISF